MNKTKKVAWHKHLKKARKLEARAHTARAPRPVPTTTRTAPPRTTARPAARQTTPRRP